MARPIGTMWVYDQPYNRHVAGPHLTWANWREVLAAPADAFHTARNG